MLPEDKKAYLQKISDQLAKWKTKINALKVKSENQTKETKKETKK